MSFCQFFEPAVGGSFQPFRRGRRAGQLPLFSGPSAKGGVPGNCPSFPALLPRAACRAAGAVSLRSTPPFTAVHGPPSYDAEGGTGSGHPATSARRFFCTLVPLPPCARAAPETPACPRTQSPPLRSHPLARGGMSPRAAPARLATQARSHRPNRLRSPLRPCHPPKSPIWWTRCLFVSVIHKNGSFGG